VSLLSSKSAALDQITTIRQLIDDSAHGSTSPSTAADMITKLIVALLKPHTSSQAKDLHLISRILTGLLAGNFDHDCLFDLLSIELDILAISPQAKEDILPTLIEITKVIEVQWQR
jgi:hypothetical protein